MKTLKDIMTEGILGGAEDVLADGDNYINSIKEEMRSLNRAIGSASIYTKLNPRTYINGRRCTIHFEHVLKSLGYDANMVEITMYQLEDDLKDWHFDIFLYKRDDGYTGRSAYEHTIYLYNGHFSKFNDILKNLLKPATKDVETFKHFLEQVARYEGQLVMRADQLLK